MFLKIHIFIDDLSGIAMTASMNKRVASKTLYPIYLFKISFLTACSSDWTYNHPLRNNSWLCVRELLLTKNILPW